MIFLAAVLGILPGFLWLIFYLREDLHPEPKRLILLVFLSGAAFTFAALLGEVAWGRILIFLKLPQLVFLTFFGLAAIEEVVKFLAAYLVVHKSPAFDEPVDAMIYMVVAALGLATVENLGAIGGELGRSIAFSELFKTTTLRFIGATLLHSLTSGLVGYYWAVGIRKLSARRYIFLGLAIATLLHLFFNYLIIQYGDIIYPVILLVVIGFFVLSDFEKLRQARV